MNPIYKNRRGASVAKQGNLQDRRNMPRAAKEPIGKYNPEALLDDSDMQDNIESLKRQFYPPHTELDAYNQLGSKLGLGPLSQQEYDELQRTGRRPEYASRPANSMSNESKIMNKKLIRPTESGLHGIVKEAKKKAPKTGTIQFNGKRVKATEDKPDRYGNPMFKIKDGGKTKRVQNFNFRPDQVEESVIRLTESDLHRLVKESVEIILREGGRVPADTQVGRHKFKGLKYDKNGNAIYTHPSKLDDPEGGTLSDDELKAHGWKFSSKHGLHGQIQDPTRLPR